MTYVGDASVGVPGGFANLQLMRTEADDVARANAGVGGQHAGSFSHDEFAAKRLAKESAAGHVVRVHVGFKHQPKPEPEFA